MGKAIRLTDYDSIYLDTNLFILFFEGNAQISKTIESILIQVTEQNIPLIASYVVYMELLVGPLTSKQNDLFNLYQNLSQRLPTLSFKTLNERVATQAAHLRSAYGISTPDAIHLATAKVHHVSMFFTRDKQLKKVTELPITLLP